jgi:hypothetical protein
LQMAVQSGHLAVVKAFLGSGADIHKKNSDGHGYSDGSTVLMAAVSHDHLAVVEALLEAGADAKATGNDGQSALHIAMLGGKWAILAALQRHERSS